MKMISPGRLWWLVSRDLKRGWEASYHEYKTLPLIRNWKLSAVSRALKDLPVHLLTGRGDWQLSAWMLASWFEFTECAWPVYIHDDGTLPKEGRVTLSRLFPDVRIISRKESDARMYALLKAYPFCEDYRRSHPLALKIFDIAEFTPGKRFLVFDSDLLFFNHPREIMDWADSGVEECRFNEDVREGSLITATEARDDLDIKIWPRVNSGLCLMAKSAIDLDLCDRALAQTTILRGHIWRIEQTLFMLCAAKFGKGGLLSKRYEVSLGKNASDDVVSRHYVGAVRNRFYGEGIKRLKEHFFPADT